MKRESFVFYKSFYESIKELDPSDQVQIYNAIFNYQFEGEESELKGICKSIFTLIIPQLEANNKRYLNGLKGGAPKGNRNATNKQPFQNTFYFYHKEVPRVAVVSSSSNPPVSQVMRNMNSNNSKAIKEPSCHKSPVK